MVHGPIGTIGLIAVAHAAVVILNEIELAQVQLRLVVAIAVMAHQSQLSLVIRLLAQMVHLNNKLFNRIRIILIEM